MQQTDIIEQVHKVFGAECPERSLYSATTDKPFPATTITKAFRNWRKFKAAYLAHVINSRTKEVSKKVVTKSEKPKYVKKDV